MNDSPVEQKVTLSDKLRWKLNDIKYWIQNKIQRAALAALRKSVGDDNYQKHAKREFKALNWPGSDDMQELICENMCDLLTVFATQGHSGSSAPYTITNFKKLASFEPLGPLTGEASEWGEPSDSEGSQQNNRCSHVFKDANGKAYDIRGKVFEEKNGCCYTNRDSHVYIKFPYTPKTEYVNV